MREKRQAHPVLNDDDKNSDTIKYAYMTVLWEKTFKTGGKNVQQLVFSAKMGSRSGEPSTRTVHALPCYGRRREF